MGPVEVRADSKGLEHARDARLADHPGEAFFFACAR
jgi:hypothetical protein